MPLFNYIRINLSIDFNLHSHVCLLQSRSTHQWRSWGGEGVGVGGAGCARTPLNTSESVGKIKVLSDFSNRLCESRKYLIFNGTTKSLHCEKHTYFESRGEVITVIIFSACCYLESGINAISRHLHDLKSQSFTRAASLNPWRGGGYSAPDCLALDPGRYAASILSKNFNILPNASYISAHVLLLQP